MRVRLDEAGALRALGRPEAAEAACRATMDALGPGVPALLGLAQCLRQQGKRDAVLACLEQATALDPGDPTLMCETAMERREMGDAAGAAALLEAGLAARPNHPALLAELARAQLSAGRAAAALETLERVVAAATDPAGPQVADVQVDIAGALLAMGRAADARARLESVLAARPDHFRALAALADMARAALDFGAAEALLRRALAATPRRVGLHLALAAVLQQAGRLGETEVCLAAAEAGLGALPEIIAQRASLSLESGTWWEMLPRIRAAAAAAAWNFIVWTQWWRVEQRTGDDAAIDACLAVAPASTPRQQSLLAYRHGVREALRWRLDAAASWQDRALRLQPDNAGALNERGYLALQALDTDVVRGCLRAIARLGPMAGLADSQAGDLPPSFLGWIHEAFETDGHAIAEMRAVLDLAPQARVAELIRVLPGHPGSIAGAVVLLVALRQAGWFTAAPAAAGGAAIPRVIVQYWDAPAPPADLAPLLDSWRSLNPAYGYRLFDDDAARAFLGARLGDAVLDAYVRVPEPARKSDLFRLAYLFAEGGIYADSDDRCLMPLEKWLPRQAGLATYQEGLGSIGTNFMAAAPGSPIIRRALMGAVAAVNNGDARMVWLTSGPGMLSRAFAGEVVDRGTAAALAGMAVFSLAEIQRVVGMHCRSAYKATDLHWLRAALGREAERKKDLLF